MNNRTLKFFHTNTRKLPTFTIMRHAESTWNADRKRVQGASVDPSIILSKNGRNSIHPALKDLSKPDVLICSSLLRCKETAESWFGCAFETIPVQKKIVSDLREINAGIFEGRYIDELTHDELWKLWLRNPSTFPGFPKGETPYEFQQRVLTAFSQICSEFNDTSQQICVITHGIVMRVLKCYLDDKDLSHLWKYDVTNLERLTLTKEHSKALQSYPIQIRDSCRRHPPL
ncbi:MAG: histidine phosphatase family protein [Gammaproteobacteria bacterium]